MNFHLFVKCTRAKTIDCEAGNGASISWGLERPLIITGRRVASVKRNSAPSARAGLSALLLFRRQSGVVWEWALEALETGIDPAVCETLCGRKAAEGYSAWMPRTAHRPDYSK